MKNLKETIANKLHEANFMVKPEDVEDIIDKVEDDDVIKLVDEAEEENNPWAICTSSVGREDKDKYESCVKKVKKQHGVSEELTEQDWEDESSSREVEYGISPEAGQDEYEEIEDIRQMGGMDEALDYDMNAISHIQDHVISRLDHVFHKILDDDVLYEIMSKKVRWAIEDAYDKHRRANEGMVKEEGIEAPAPEQPQVDVKDLQRDVQKFLDKLELGQFKAILARIDKPVEKAELLAAFGERIGVPRTKLPILMQQLRQTAESVNPRMTKDALIETVDAVRERNVIKRVKKKDINE